MWVAAGDGQSNQKARRVKANEKAKRDSVRAKFQRDYARKPQGKEITKRHNKN